MPLEFDDDKEINSLDSQVYYSKPTKMSVLLIKTGLVKDVQSAQKVFIWTTIIFFALTAYIFVFYVFDFRISNPFSPSTGQNQQSASSTLQMIQRLREQRLKQQ